jgi:hypothetical protein
VAVAEEAKVAEAATAPVEAPAAPAEPAKSSETPVMDKLEEISSGKKRGLGSRRGRDATEARVADTSGEAEGEGRAAVLREEEAANTNLESTLPASNATGDQVADTKVLPPSTEELPAPAAPTQQQLFKQTIDAQRTTRARARPRPGAGPIGPALPLNPCLCGEPAQSGPGAVQSSPRAVRRLAGAHLLDDDERGCVLCTPPVASNALPDSRRCSDDCPAFWRPYKRAVDCPC